MPRTFKTIISYAPSILLSISILSACGGGGGSGSTTQTPIQTPTPIPTVNISLSQSKVTVGASVTATWSSTNATSCVGMDSMSGTKAVNSSEVITPTSGGQYTYTISCNGSGGTAKNSVLLTVPISVKASSFENRNDMNIVPFAIPRVPFKFDTNLKAYALADFQQNGKLSLIVGNYGNGAWDTSFQKGTFSFYSRETETSAWVDITSALLDDNSGCMLPRKAIIADFNGDGKPDVFFACTGTDIVLPLIMENMYGEHPHMLLSQPNGKYKNVTMDFNCYCHSASAAEMNNKGYADLVVTDVPMGGWINGVQVGPFSTSTTPFFLINNKDGTFTKSVSHLPTHMDSKQIYSTELIDFNGDGKYDWWFGGNAHYGNYIALNNGSNVFDNSPPIELPTTTKDSVQLDIQFKNGKIYLYSATTDYSDPSKSPYTGDLIQRIDFSTLISTTIYQHSGYYFDSMGKQMDQFFGWMQIFNDKIVASDATYSISVGL